MKLEKLDHLVLPVSDIDRMAEFYTKHLGMHKRTFGNGRVALHFGDQKINLHSAGWDYEPKAAVSIAGSADRAVDAFAASTTATRTTAAIDVWGLRVIGEPRPGRAGVKGLGRPCEFSRMRTRRTVSASSG